MSLLRMMALSPSRVCQIAIVALVCSGATPAAGQTTEGTLFGTVADAQGGVLPGVTVTLTNQDTGISRTLVTSNEGEYRAPGLLPGTYEIVVVLAGFATVQVTDLGLGSQQVARQDVQMQLSAIEETVTVTGDAPQVEVTRSEVSVTITEEQLEMLPIANRAVISFALLLPGTSTDGSRPRRNNAQVGAGTLRFTTTSLIDGMQNMSTKAGEPRQDLPKPAVREVRVIQTLPNAEFGGRAGGVVSVVSRGGTNLFSGEAYEFFRNKSLVRIDPLTQATLDETGESAPPFSRHQFGGALGGPILQNRMHFFVAAEDTEQHRTYRVDSGRSEFYGKYEGIFENNHTNRLFFGRIDAQLTPSQNAYVRYAYQGGKFECDGCGGDSYSGETLYIERDTVLAAHTWVLGTRFLNEFRFGWSEQWHHGMPMGAPEQFGLEMTPERELYTQPEYHFPSFSYVPEPDYFNHNSPVEPEIRNDFSMLFSDHSLKIGYSFQNIYLQEDQQGKSAGSWEFGTDQFFDIDDPNVMANMRDPIRFRATFPHWIERQDHHYHQFYVQDEWRPASNLTLNLGFRYERDTGVWNNDRDNDTFYPTPLPYVNFSSRGDNNNWSPRVGVVWDPTDTGRTVVRFGAGRQFNVIQNGIPGSETGAFKQNSVNIKNPSYPDPYAGRPRESFLSSKPRNIRIVRDDLENPYSDMFTAGVSQELGESLALHVDALVTNSSKFDVGVEINTEDPATGKRPLTEWGEIRQDQSIGWQKYRALYVRLQKRLSNNYQYQVAYTLAKTTDNSFSSTSTGNRTDQLRPDLDAGYSNQDRRHAFVLSGATVLPGDITLGGVWTLRSNRPFRARAGRDLNNDGNNTDFVPGTKKGDGNRRDLTEFLDLVNAWRLTQKRSPITAEQIDSDAYNRLDVRVSKAFNVGSTRRVELIGQVFNLLGRTNLGGIGFNRQENSRSALFGQILGAQNKQEAELALRFTF